MRDLVNVRVNPRIRLFSPSSMSPAVVLSRILLLDLCLVRVRFLNHVVGSNRSAISRMLTS